MFVINSLLSLKGTTPCISVLNLEKLLKTRNLACIFYNFFIIKKNKYIYIYLCVCVLWFFLCSVSLLLLSDFLSNLLYSVL